MNYIRRKSGVKNGMTDGRLWSSDMEVSSSYGFKDLFD